MTHRRFETTSPHGLTMNIRGNPQMAPETLAALHTAMELAYIQTVYPEKRADGWPLCPRCGEDELWSGLAWDGSDPRPPMEAWILAGLCCYKCSWCSLWETRA